MRGDISTRGPRFEGFWQERLYATFTVIRADGTPHVSPVGVTLDVAAGIARVISSGTSVKVRLVGSGAAVAVCQVDGRDWSTLEGHATVLRDAVAVGDAEDRYASRYRVPRVNPARVVIEIRVTRVLGTV